MNSRQRSNRKLVFFFCAVFLSGLLISRLTERFVVRAVAPIWRLGDSLEVLPGEYFVLARPPQTPYDTLVIDGPVPIGEVVKMREGPLLGIVSDSFAKQAKVKLFSSPGEETEAVLERTDTPVKLIGQGFGNFLIQVPREIEVVVGDKILSPDRNKNLLAVVGSVEVNATDAFKKVRAKSPINLFSVRKVSVQ